MKLLVGLGNVGSHFEGTRHNVGFTTLELFASAHNLSWQQKDKFKAAVAEGVVDGQKVLLAKPSTFYNLSGEAVLAIKQFYKIELPDILVVHDELALPLGVVRARLGGADAGNNGIKSIIQTIGSEFNRVRVGIANEQLPLIGATDFVLGRFGHDETPTLHDATKHAIDMIESFSNGSLQHTTKQV